MNKTVFANAMVAHVWAQQTQSEGRSNNGNFWFKDGTIYSYQTPIATLLNVKGQGQVALVTSETYSITTSSKHMNPIYRALNASHIFRVPTLIAGWNGRARYPLDHGTNLAHLVKEYQGEAARLMRKRDSIEDYHRERLSEQHDKALEYATVFKLKRPSIKTPAQYLKEIADAHAARDTPARIAKRAAAQKARDAKAARVTELQRAELAVQLQAWKDGKLSLRDVRGLGHGGPVYLRIKGDALETSQGASVPLAHAVRAFKFVKACKEAGKEWHCNGHSIHVGHFTLDSISADGTMRAGCHTIAWPQIEEAAKAAGVWNEPASTEALQPSRGAA